MYDDVAPGLIAGGLVAAEAKTSIASKAAAHLPITGTHLISIVLVAFGLLVLGLVLMRITRGEN